jgi:hypothetical protein
MWLGEVLLAYRPALHAVMHLQIVEAARQLTRRYVANGPHCWADVNRANRKPQCGRNLTKHWMLSGHVRAWGRYHSRIFGSMGGEYGPLGRRQRGRGRAVLGRRPSIIRSLFAALDYFAGRIDHA